jgi:hypothetical protein
MTVTSVFRQERKRSNDKSPAKRGLEYHARLKGRYERSQCKAKIGEEAECICQYMSIPSRSSTQQWQAQ